MQFWMPTTENPDLIYDKGGNAQLSSSYAPYDSMGATKLKDGMKWLFDARQ